MILMTFAAAAMLPPSHVDDRIVRTVDCRPGIIRTALESDPRPRTAPSSPKGDARKGGPRRCIVLAGV
jgi:hypothetical protein